jgi:cell division protein FtsB
MREFQERRLLRKIFLSRISFFLFLAFFIFLSFSIKESYNKKRQAALKNQEIVDEIGELENRKSDLEANIRNLQTPEGIEEELRQRFQIKKPDEEFLVILDDEGGVNAEILVDENEGFFKKVYSFIKDVF